MKRNTIKKVLKDIHILWKEKGIKNKVMTIVIGFSVFSCLILLLISSVLKSFSSSFINRNIKIVRKNTTLISKDIPKKSNMDTEAEASNSQKEDEKYTVDNNKINGISTNSSSSSGENVQNTQPSQQQPQQSTPQPDKNQVSIQIPSGNIIDTEVLNYINNLRTSLGLSSLIWDNNIYSYAKIRAEEITSVYSHIRPNGQSSIISAPVSIHAENLAYGQISANEIFTDWKGSPNHYQNFVNSSYTRGAVAKAIKDGVYYWVFLAY